VREIVFPPTITDTKVRAAADTYIGLTGEMRQADRAVVELEGQRAAVIEADRRSFAEAIRRGEEEPAPVAVERFEQELAAARRRAEGLAAAVTGAEAELVQVVEERRAAWGADIDRQVEKSRASVSKAVAALEAAVAELSGLLSTAAWVASFPNKVSTLRPPVATSAVPGLVGQNREAIPWPTVLAALRQFAERPAAAVMAS
jgi:hypothetical protein